VRTLQDYMGNAQRLGIAIPAFNAPYPEMVRPIVQALVDTATFGLVEVARVEWEKFGSKSLETIQQEFDKWAPLDCVRLHLDHIPAVDEDGRQVDYMPFIRRAVDCGYHSVMIDASRLPLEENIAATAQVVDYAHRHDVAVESELGAVIGHEEGAIPSYEELYRTKMGFTDPDEATEFVNRTGVDWLSAAFGSIHGAVSQARRNLTKVQARLDIEHLDRLVEATNVPIVLHGGSGIEAESLRTAFRHGVCKLNVGTEVRQAYERALKESGPEAAGQKAYETVSRLIEETYQLAGSRDRL
jgi:fructose-bisphosphate aldolase, class II